VQLALTEQGQEVTRRAIEVVHGLLQQLLDPLGGLDSARTREFTRDLTILLDTPLDPFSENETEQS
jgi:DNA-binding MarR family transcriptional regulator